MQKLSPLTIPKVWLLLGTATLIFVSACKKQSTTPPSPEVSTEAFVEELAIAIPDANPVNSVPVDPASHLGFASHVPSNAALFASFYNADERASSIFNTLLEANLIFAPEEGTEIEDTNSLEELAEQALPYIGDEAFFFVGSGIGLQFETLSRSYRAAAAATTGALVGLVLDAANKEDPLEDLNGNQDQIVAEIFNDLLDVVEKDSRVQIPSLVMGWKPDPEKKSECIEAIKSALEFIVAKNPSMKQTSFERSSVEMTGYRANGRDLFGEFLAEAREDLADQDRDDEWKETISPERLERVLSAFENLEFTIATGSIDGYILLYLGNGAEGFSLADQPDDSLAASRDLKWTSPFADKQVLAFSYVSEEVIKAGLPSLDGSIYWMSISKAVRAPIEDQGRFRKILGEMADNERQLAQRDPSPWSGILLKDQGLRLETRGGWPKPDLDYTTPLQMTDAATSAKPAIRAHWVENRERNNQEWRRTELLGEMLEAILTEFQTAGIGEEHMVPESGPRLFMEQVRNLNKAYRHEFRNGIGDEVAFIADFHGMTPPIPGIPADILSRLELPRFIIARPVNDRSKLAASGKAFIKIWKDSITKTNELLETSLPFFSPLSIESKQLTTWYFPTPINGGDFVPGISLNDKVWLMGTSRSMADKFSKHLKPPNHIEETGMMIEVDFQAIQQWAEDVYNLTQDQSEELTKQAPTAVKELDTKENRQAFSSALKRLEAYRYRHWMESGTPRTTHHLKLTPRDS